MTLSPTAARALAVASWLFPFYAITGFVLWSLAPAYKALAEGEPLSGFAISYGLSRLVLEREDTGSSFVFSPVQDLPWVALFPLIGSVFVRSPRLGFATGLALVAAAANASEFTDLAIRFNAPGVAFLSGATGFAGLLLLSSQWAIPSYLGRARVLAAVAVPLPLLSLALTALDRDIQFDWRLIGQTGAKCGAWALLAALAAIPFLRCSIPRYGFAIPTGLVCSLVLLAAIPMLRAWSIEKRGARIAEKALLLLHGTPAVDPAGPYPRLFFQRGVNFTAEFPHGYESYEALQMLKKLHSSGVDSIALVPYGSVAKSSPQVRLNAGSHHHESDRGIEQLSRYAHHLGIKVMLKPHLSVEGGSAANLSFSTSHEVDAWFSSYASFLEHYAKLARQIHADLFCTGVELAGLTKHDAHWRRLIARLRAIYPGPLLYAAAHGPDFEQTPFWDALDYIGLSNYYPLPDGLDTSALVALVEQVQRRYVKPVVFAEAGFGADPDAHRQPWHASGRGRDRDHQARCYEALFRAFFDKEWFHGFYWWKVGTVEAGGSGSHLIWRTPAMDVVAKWYMGKSKTPPPRKPQAGRNPAIGSW